MFVVLPYHLNVVVVVVVDVVAVLYCMPEVSMEELTPPPPT